MTVLDLPKTLYDDVMSNYPTGTAPWLIKTSIDEDYLATIIEGETTVDIAVMQELASDSFSNLRATVAANPNAPPTLLDVLAVDIDRDVRGYVLENPNTSPVTKAYIRMGGYGEMTLEQFKEAVKL